jgi:hypothetical protein
MVKNGKINQEQIEEILLSFKKASARYPTFEEFCSHGKNILPSRPMSAVQKEKLRQKVKYIVTKQKKMERSCDKKEVYMDDTAPEKIENNTSKDAIVNDF